jgi:putative membrane protein insertion efficiency factor
VTDPGDGAYDDWAARYQAWDQQHGEQWRAQFPQGPAAQQPQQENAGRQALDACARLDDKIECWTCGCFGSSWIMALTLAPLLRWGTPSAPRARPRTTVPAQAGLAAIRGYQLAISPHLPVRCRYTPTCSAYGADAVRRYGLATGARLTAARIRRCTRDVPFATPDPLR